MSKEEVGMADCNLVLKNIAAGGQCGWSTGIREGYGDGMREYRACFRFFKCNLSDRSVLAVL